MKVLDFGLAKAMDPVGSAPNVSAVSNDHHAGHDDGRGRDSRHGRLHESRAGARKAGRIDATDVWAFGCVLYEMLTGRQCFETGESISDAVAAILKNEPDWSALPADAPAYLRTLLRRCLQKDPQKRLPHIGVARLEIAEGGNEVREGTAHGSSTRSRSSRVGAASGWALAGLLLVATLLLVRAHYGVPPRDDKELRRSSVFSILPPARSLMDGIAVSPDGLHVAFRAVANKQVALWVRDVTSGAAHALPGTEDLDDALFWSADSRSLGFALSKKLKRVALEGGAAQTLTDAPLLQGGTWSSAGVILFARDQNDGIYQIAASGGTAIRITAPDTAHGEYSHTFPSFLPDGRHFLFSVANADSSKNSIRIGELGSSDTRLLLQTSSNAVHADTPYGGHLLFARDGLLFAQPMDASSLTLRGAPVQIGSDVRQRGRGGLIVARAEFSTSSTGLLAFLQPQPRISHLTWVDRGGRPLQSVGPPGQYGHFALSPDDQRVVVDARAPGVEGSDIALLELSNGTLSRVTFEPGRFSLSRWSPDGQQIVVNLQPDRNEPPGLFVKPVGGGSPVRMYLIGWERAGISQRLDA